MMLLTMQRTTSMTTNLLHCQNPMLLSLDRLLAVCVAFVWKAQLTNVCVCNAMSVLAYWQSTGNRQNMHGNTQSLFGLRPTRTSGSSALAWANRTCLLNVKFAPYTLVQYGHENSVETSDISHYIYIYIYRNQLIYHTHVCKQTWPRALGPS